MVGAIPGAYEQAFGFDSSMQEDVESDEEVENPGAGCVAIGLNREEKLRIRAPWALSLIVKTFGRNVGFMFLSTKTRSLWNPVGRMDCIDIGHDCFLIKFELQLDLDNVLKGGLWFVGQHFLAIRQWEPDFRPSLATFSSTAVWVRFLELPLEYYELSLLKKMGSAIGLILRFDSHTVNGVQGRYARLCIQVNLDKPLPQTILIHQGCVQAVQYEGINQLCFSCGYIGHKKEHCPFVVRAPSPPKTVNNGDPEPNIDKAHTSGEELFGEWMMVTRKKKHVMPKNAISAKQVGEDGSPIDGLNTNDKSFTGQREGKCKAQAFSEKVTSITAHVPFNRSNKGKGKSVHSKSPTLNSLSVPTLLSKDIPVFSSKPSTPTPLIPIFSFGNGSTSGKVGNLSQTQDYSSERRDHQRDPSRPHFDLGLVRSPNDGSLAKHLPPHGEKQDIRTTRPLRYGMDPHSKPMVVLPHGPTSPSTIRSNDIKMVCSSIAATPLRTLVDRTRGEVSVQGDCSKENSVGNPDGMCCDEQLLSGEDAAILQADNSLNDPSQKLYGTPGDLKACSDSFPQSLGTEGGANPSMEIEGSGR